MNEAAETGEYVGCIEFAYRAADDKAAVDILRAVQKAVLATKTVDSENLEITVETKLKLIALDKVPESVENLPEVLVNEENP